MSSSSPSCVLPFAERRILLSPWLGNLLGLSTAGADIVEQGGYFFSLLESPFTPNSILGAAKPVELILPGQYAGNSSGISFFWDNSYEDGERANPYTIDIDLPAELVPSSTMIVDEGRVDVESLANVTPISGNATIAYAGAVYPVQRTWEAAFQLEASSVMTDLVNTCPFRLVQSVYRPAATSYYWLDMGRWEVTYETTATVAEGEFWSWVLNESIPASMIFYPDGNLNAVYVLISSDRIETTIGVDADLVSTVFDGGAHVHKEYSGDTVIDNDTGARITAVDFVGVWPDLTLAATFSYTGPPGGGGVLVRAIISTKLWMFFPYDWS